MRGLQEVELGIPALSFGQTRQKLLPIPCNELCCKLHHLHVDVCQHRVTNVELVRWRRLNLLLQVFNIAENHLSQLPLLLVFFG